jgi:diguanylate cyclase (GGDEF)-like protein
MLPTLESALEPPGTLPEPDRMSTVVNYVCYLGFPAHVLFIPLFISLGVPFLAWFNILSCTAWAAAWWLNRRGNLWASINVLTAEVVIHAVIATTFLGWRSGFHAPLMPTITVIMINHRLRRATMFGQAMSLVVLYAVLYAYTGDYVAPGLSPHLLNVLNYVHMVIVFAALCIVSYFYREASIRAEKRLEDLATTDQLTRLANRHKMRELLEMERGRSQRSGNPFCLIMADIDHFKSINDTYGHDFGDAVLRTSAAALRATARGHETVARWGGEEFLVLLPETRLPGALDAAERMRAAVERQRFDHDGTAATVTMTFGAALHNPGDDVEETVKHADRALYEGKDSGRNRVVA